MDAITTLITYLPDGLTGTIGFDDAQHFLQELTIQHIRNVLTPAEEEVLLIAIELKEFSNSSLSKKTKKSKQYINKFISKFQEKNFIYQSRREGRNIYYVVTPNLLVCS